MGTLWIYPKSLFFDFFLIFWYNKYRKLGKEKSYGYFVEYSIDVDYLFGGRGCVLAPGKGRELAYGAYAAVHFGDSRMVLSF